MTNLRGVFLKEIQELGEVSGEETDSCSPEKLLCLGVLERAVRDLKPYASRKDRREALTWFNLFFKKLAVQQPPYLYDLEQIIEAIPLGVSQIEYLKELVKEAEAHERAEQEKNKISDRQKEQKQRENRRAGVGQLSKRKRLYYCETYRAMQRQA